jgi:hypothetical protein
MGGSGALYDKGDGEIIRTAGQHTAGQATRLPGVLDRPRAETVVVAVARRLRCAAAVPARSGQTTGNFSP